MFLFSSRPQLSKISQPDMNTVMQVKVSILNFIVAPMKYTIFYLRLNFIYRQNISLTLSFATALVNL